MTILDRIREVDDNILKAQEEIGKMFTGEKSSSVKQVGEKYEQIQNLFEAKKSLYDILKRIVKLYTLSGKSQDEDIKVIKTNLFNFIDLINEYEEYYDDEPKYIQMYNEVKPIMDKYMREEITKLNKDVQKLEDEKENLRRTAQQLDVMNTNLRTQNRLSSSMIKWVQCKKCRKDYYQYYPMGQCECGSYDSEEVDAYLPDLINEKRKLEKTIKGYELRINGECGLLSLIDLHVEEKKELKDRLNESIKLNLDWATNHKKLGNKINEVMNKHIHAGCNGYPECKNCAVIKALKEIRDD